LGIGDYMHLAVEGAFDAAIFQRLREERARNFLQIFQVNSNLCFECKTN
jgi:hypothetical protein